MTTKTLRTHQGWAFVPTNIRGECLKATHTGKEGKSLKQNQDQDKRKTRATPTTRIGVPCCVPFLIANAIVFIMFNNVISFNTPPLQMKPMTYFQGCKRNRNITGMHVMQGCVDCPGQGFRVPSHDTTHATLHASNR